MKEESIQQERIPRRILPGGDAVPAIGLGTFGSDKYGPEEVGPGRLRGIRQGYWLIDCAAVYQNEAQVGEALEHALKKGLAKREELFLISKVWNDRHGEGEGVASCRQSLKDLRQDYLTSIWCIGPFPNYHAPGCSGDAEPLIPVPSAYRNS